MIGPKPTVTQGTQLRHFINTMKLRWRKTVRFTPIGYLLGLERLAAYFHKHRESHIQYHAIITLHTIKEAKGLHATQTTAVALNFTFKTRHYKEFRRFFCFHLIYQLPCKASKGKLGGSKESETSIVHTAGQTLKKLHPSIHPSVTATAFCVRPSKSSTRY